MFTSPPTIRVENVVYKSWNKPALKVGTLAPKTVDHTQINRSSKRLITHIWRIRGNTNAGGNATDFSAEPYRVGCVGCGAQLDFRVRLKVHTELFKSVERFRKPNSSISYKPALLYTILLMSQGITPIATVRQF